MPYCFVFVFTLQYSVFPARNRFPICLMKISNFEGLGVPFPRPVFFVIDYMTAPETLL
jgi:hypothetical protein